MEHNNKQFQLIKFCTLGTTLEWYDFTLFGVMSSSLAQLFFPNETKTIALLATFGIFASGFIMRPVGAFFLGHLGDKYGRKSTLCLNMLVVTVATAAIGLLPVFSQIGTCAPILLVCLRMLQGFFVGAEYSGVITYLSEMSDEKNLCFLSSFSVFGVIGGLLLGSVTSTLVMTTMPKDFFIAFGWRIPFLASIFLGIVGYEIRKKLDESSSFMALQTKNKILKYPIVGIVKNYKIPLLAVIIFFGAATVATYLVFMYIPVMLIATSSTKPKLALLANSVGILILALFIPLFASISDKMGMLKMMGNGAILFILFSFPTFYLFHYNNMFLTLVAQSIFAIFTATFVAPLPAVIAGLFPTNVRYSGSSMGLNLSAAFFGGTAPLVATWLTKSTANQNSPAWYLVLFFCAALACIIHLNKIPRYSTK